MSIDEGDGLTEGEVEKICQHFYREYAHCAQLRLPEGTLAARIQARAAACGLAVRATHGIQTTEDLDRIDAVLVDLFHPTSRLEGLDAYLAQKERELAQEGIRLKRSSLLEAVQHDPYAIQYAALVRSLRADGFLLGRQDALILEGFDANIAALARHQPNPHLGVAYGAFPRGQGSPLFGVLCTPFLRETFNDLVAIKQGILATKTGVELALCLTLAHDMLLPDTPTPADGIEGGIPNHTMRGIDDARLYARVTDAMLRAQATSISDPDLLRAHNERNRLTVERAIGIARDIGDLTREYRNLFVLYGKFDIMTWQHPTQANNTNCLQHFLPTRRCLILTPTKVHTPQELNNNINARIRALNGRIPKMSSNASRVE